MPPQRISPEVAQRRFLRAAWNLMLQRVPKNPLQRLIDEVVPELRAIGYVRDIEGLSTNSVPSSGDSSSVASQEIQKILSRLRPPKSEIIRDKHRRKQQARDILTRWARGHRPASPEENLLWLVDYANRFCAAWEPTYFAATEFAPDLLPQSPRDGPVLSPPSQPPFLMIPMENPLRGSGEPRETYERRAKQAFKEYLKRLRELPRARSPRIYKARASEEDITAYEWVILRRWCGWPPSKILEKHPSLHEDPADARSKISMAIRRTEGRLGFVSGRSNE